MAYPHRRAKGTAGSAVHLYVQVAPDAKDVLDRIHAATGAPKWVVMEEILRHVELDDDGVPVFWPNSVSPQEALDIPA